MMPEIPYPTSEIQYRKFLWSVLIFFFLIALAFIPVMTKRIFNQTNRYAAVNYGVTYHLVTVLLNRLLYPAAVRRWMISDNAFQMHYEKHIGLKAVSLSTKMKSDFYLSKGKCKGGERNAYN